MRAVWQFAGRLTHPPVEVLVISIVLAMILAIAGPGILQIRERARESRQEHQLKSLGMAMSNYHESFLSYPTSPPGRKPTSVPKKAPTEPVQLVSPLVIAPMGIR